MQTKTEQIKQNNTTIKPKALAHESQDTQSKQALPTTAIDESADERRDLLADQNSLNALKARINKAHDSFTWTKPNSSQSTNENTEPPELNRQPAFRR